MTTPSANYSLPGVDVDIGDLGLRVSAPVPGPKLTIIGVTDSTLSGAGNVNEPYLIQSFPTAIQALKNTDGTDSELSHALEKAVEAGAQHVEVVITAQATSFATENDRWDALAASLKALKAHPMDIVVSDKAYADAKGLSGTDPNGESRTNYIRMFGDFCYRSTKIGNTTKAVVGAMPLLEIANLENWSAAPTSRAGELFNTPTLAQLNEWPYHFRGENNSSTGLHDHSSETELTGFVSGSVEGSPGVISGTYDGWARTEAGVIATDHLGNNVDGGRAVSVVAMPVRQTLSSTRTRAAKLNQGTQFTENTNGAVAYAAMLTTLKPGDSPTNRPVRSLVPARSIPRDFATDLNNLRIVTAVSRDSGLIVSKGVTAAHNAGVNTKSDFSNYTSFETVILAVDIARVVVNPYIGKQSAPEIINALQNELDQALNTLVNKNLASRVTATIIQTRDDQILGNLDVELDIVPYGEIDNINFRALLSRS